MNELQQITDLRNELHKHNYKYYVLNAPDISDEQFDRLMHTLEALEAKHPECFDPNSPTQRVGSDVNSEFSQVEHRYPMLSLANTYNEQEVADFYNSIKKLLNGEAFEICCELKYDGLSISLLYENGKLIRAITRGDGVRGDDVTANVKTIKSIPLVLQGDDYPDVFEMRGEILMPWKVFEKLNKERELAEEPLFANPRNAASGTLKSLKSSLVSKRSLDAYLYYMLGEELPSATHYGNLEKAKTWGFKIGEGIKKVKTLQEIYDFIAYWDTERKNLPVATDGIVLKVNAIEQQKQLGYTAKSPRWAIAYKFKAERELTQLESVSYQIGRTGAVTPVANMSPVQLAGTIVKRATLNNADFITSLDLHINDYVYVEKGGEIIPKIVGVDATKRSLNATPIRFIDKCPECGTPLIRYEGEAAYYCPNEDGCSPQIKGKIEHFISRKAMNIDSLGPETIDEYYRKGLITNIASLYSLRLEDINDGGKRNKSAQKVIQAIEKSKAVPFERVLFALGIRFVGETSARLIARKFTSIEMLKSATIEQLMQVDGVGEVIAQSIKAYFLNEKNVEIVSQLEAMGVQMAIKEDETKPTSTLLQDLSIVISGVFTHHSRDEYKAIIEQHGGKNVGSISSKTSFILAGDNMGPSKLQKAEKLGIKIVNEEEFLSMLNN
jgi:DNA ligase (NAD+)